MTAQRFLLAMTGGLAVLTGIAFVLPQAAQSQPDASGVAKTTGEPVLIELFTSQGCSSCPPADRLAQSLALRADLVVIARPVTYWDRLGWKDTLAREDNTQLQQAYAWRRLAGRNGVYTPQMVVDGAYGAVGSDADRVAAGVKSHGSQSSAAIRVNDLGAEGFAVGLGGDTAAPAELMLVAVTRTVDVRIGRGENGGRTVSYTNVLRNERRIAMWEGGKASQIITRDQLNIAGADRYALVLRVPDGGTVLAARWL